jgi:hypothetical protein
MTRGKPDSGLRLPSGSGANVCRPDDCQSRDPTHPEQRPLFVPTSSCPDIRTCSSPGRAPIQRRSSSVPGSDAPPHTRSDTPAGRSRNPSPRHMASSDSWCASNHLPQAICSYLHNSSRGAGEAMLHAKACNACARVMWKCWCVLPGRPAKTTCWASSQASSVHPRP